MEKKLPEVIKIKSITELKIGDTLVYTGDPRGTGAWPPEIGTEVLLENPNHIIWAGIEIIERGRGWWPKAKN